MALGNARDHREDMVLWLALQVMMTDNVALADDALQDRLIILQDRIENMMRARLGLPDRGGRVPVHRLLGSLAVRLVRAGKWPVTVVP